MHPSNNINANNIDDIFKYHAPNEQQIKAYSDLRETAKVLAKVILEHCPQSADRAAAMRKLRECVMTANAAIALGEL